MFLVQVKYFRNNDNWVDYGLSYTEELAKKDFTILKEHGHCFGYRLIQVIDEGYIEKNA